MMSRMFLAACSVLFACVFASSLAFGEEAMDARVRAIWERHWRSYAKQCAEFEGGFIVCPSYERRYPSSAGITIRQAEAKLSRKVREAGGGVVTTRTVKRPIQEAKAMALPVPKLRVGEYGTLASVQVREVLGEESMLVEKVYLLDPEQVREDYRADRDKMNKAGGKQKAGDAEQQLEDRFKQRNAVLKKHKDKRHRSMKLRLEGFFSLGLVEGDRWLGPNGEGLVVVIVKQEPYGSERRPRQRLVAVALKGINWGLDEDTFVRLLDERGFSRAKFVELIVRRMAEDDPKTARRRVFGAIIAGKPSGPEASEKLDEKARESGGNGNL